MTQWSEINPRERSGGLQVAMRRQTRPGEYRYTFVHDELEIDDPALDTTGRFLPPPGITVLRSGVLTAVRRPGPGTLPTAPCWW